MDNRTSANVDYDVFGKPVDLEISGGAGEYGNMINGMYNPSGEKGGAPAYHKSGDNTIKLLYCEATNQWKIRQLLPNQRKPVTLAKITSERVRPEQMSSMNKWRVKARSFFLKNFVESPEVKLKATL